ncbi:hypothetical protein NVP1113A_45 [Vibrio phage 1.113.A._10N.286.51.E7]|nr:hypothetical protein NVP1113A_45 [Vibrio phage 1.113.A._10N.286.51.E7]
MRGGGGGKGVLGFLEWKGGFLGLGGVKRGGGVFFGGKKPPGGGGGGGGECLWQRVVINVNYRINCKLRFEKISLLNHWEFKIPPTITQC